MSKHKWTTENIPDLKRKVIIVTGGNSGIGFESAKAFAEKGASVIIACRSLEKGEQAKQKVLDKNLGADIQVMELDLADLSSVRRFVNAFKQTHKRLDILLNNAGIMIVPFSLTRDGFENQLGTNHLGHFALTGLLLDMIIKTPNSRVVNVSSLAHKKAIIDFDNLLYDNGPSYHPMDAYRRSKLANLLFTYELQRFFESHNSSSIAVVAHPGVSLTNLARHKVGDSIFRLLSPIAGLFLQNSEMGALPLIRACVDPDVKGGEYYGPGSSSEWRGYPVLVESTEASKNKDNAKKLWEMSEELTGIQYPNTQLAVDTV